MSFLTLVCKPSHKPATHRRFFNTIFFVTHRFCDCKVCGNNGLVFDGEQNTQGPAPLEDNIVVAFHAFGDTPYDKRCSTCNTCIAPDGVTKQDDCEIYDCTLKNSTLPDLATENTW